MLPYIAAWILWVIGGFSIVTVVTQEGFFSTHAIRQGRTDGLRKPGPTRSHGGAKARWKNGSSWIPCKHMDDQDISVFLCIPPFPSSNQFIDLKHIYLYPESIRIITIVQPQCQDRNLYFQLPGFRDCPPSFAYSNIPLNNHCDNIIILSIVIIIN